jgi:hypothetical protein
MYNADIIVLLDNVKHSKSSFTHRNRIKANDKEFLLSIPILNKESIINELLIFEPKVSVKKHWRVIETNYRRAKFWSFLAEELETLYLKDWNKLVDLNIEIIRLMSRKLGINTKILIASELPDITGEGSDRNLSISKTLNAKVYLSGNGAKAYNDEESFARNSIKIIYNSFEHPIYPQIGKNFLPNLSIIDLLFNCGPESKNFLYTTNGAIV